MTVHPADITVSPAEQPAAALCSDPGGTRVRLSRCLLCISTLHTCSLIGHTLIFNTAVH